MTALSHSPSDVLRYLMIDLGLGTLPTDGGAWPVYADDEPDQPDNCITVYWTTDRKDADSMVDGEALKHRGASVRVRSTTSPVGSAKAETIVATLLARSSAYHTVTIEATQYVVSAVSLASGPIHIGKETPNSSREIYTINFLLPIRQL